MNRLVVRQAAAGLAAYLLATDERARTRGVVIGYDARRKSDVFALDTARVMAAHGIRALLLPGPLPTPVVAWALTELDAAAAVVVTASHNPPRDNGYKVYLGDGAQIVPPHDVGISAEIERIDPTAVALAAEDDPLIERLDRRRRRPLRGCRRRPCGVRPDVAGVPVAYTPMHGVGGRIVLRRVRGGRVPGAGRRRVAVRARPDVPDGVVPQPGGAGGDGPGDGAGVGARARRSPSPTTPTPTGSAPRSPSPTARGGGWAATSSAGCWPTTSSATPTATTGWS